MPMTAKFTEVPSNGLRKPRRDNQPTFLEVKFNCPKNKLQKDKGAIR